jgi:serine O-acetyltransferase
MSNSENRSAYSLDSQRYGKNPSLLDRHALRFLKLLRHTQESSNPVWKLQLLREVERYGLEISHNAKIGPGLYLGHAYGITVNSGATIGRNCNLHKGVTIGQENRGARKGAPTVGDCVWIGVNATVVGAITIGDDVLIAPNSYVNCDVPSHSIVLGNPCRIIRRDNATEGYIENTV